MLVAPEVRMASAGFAVAPFADLPSFWRRARRWLASPRGLLIVVCLAHLAAALVFVAAHHMWWQQDEVVYLSQVAAHTPALKFTPPRARGMPVLLYPVVHFTRNVTIIRFYAAALGTLGMYFGFRPWLRLGYSRSVAAAALLLSALWSASFFGDLVQPNFFVAVSGLAVAGYGVLALRAVNKRRYLVAAAGWAALMGLIRPSDATWLVVPLVLALLAVRAVPARRRLVVGSTLLVGLGLGWSEWVIEAFVRYGGFFHRLHEANAQNTPGLHFSLLAEARDINGPILCRPCTGVPLSVSHFAWWFAVPPLIALGLASARGTRRLLPLALATLGGTTLLLEYLLTISYAAPRFLLPGYALLALPSAAGIAALIRWRPGSVQHRAIVTAAIALFAVQLATQGNTLKHEVAIATSNRDRFLTAAKVLRHQGVHAPCTVFGHLGPPVAYALRCNDLPEGAAAVAAVPTGLTAVNVTDTPDLAAFRGWQSVQLGFSGHWKQWTGHILRPGDPPPP